MEDRRAGGGVSGPFMGRKNLDQSKVEERGTKRSFAIEGGEMGLMNAPSSSIQFLRLNTLKNWLGFAQVVGNAYQLLTYLLFHDINARRRSIQCKDMRVQTVMLHVKNQMQD